MDSQFHPKQLISLEELSKRLAALETSDNRYAMRGGLAVTYGADGRIASLSADYILAGTIDASVINVENLDASNITTGTLSANRIAAGSIAASKLSVSDLSAISANLGTVTAGTITGVTITGSLVRTSSSGIRVQLNDSTDGLEFTDSSGNVVFTMLTNGVQVGISGSAIWVSGTLDMDGGHIDGIGYLKFNESGNQTTSGRMWFYNAGGGNYYFRGRMGSWNGQFDMSSF